MLQSLQVVPSKEPRTDLLNWLNSLLPPTAPNGTTLTPVQKVEHCGNCMAYSLILPDMLPIRCPSLLTRVKVPAHHEFEAVANLKLMTEALQRNGIPKPEPLTETPDKVIRGNFHSNLLLLQWFRGLHTALQEAEIEPGQGRVTLEPERSSLNSSCLSGPAISEDSQRLRQLTQQQVGATPMRPSRGGNVDHHIYGDKGNTNNNSRMRSSTREAARPLDKRVGEARVQGDATAAAAAAIIQRAKIRSSSEDPSADRWHVPQEPLNSSLPSQELSVGGRAGVPPLAVSGGAPRTPLAAVASSRQQPQQASQPRESSGVTAPINGGVASPSPSPAPPAQRSTQRVTTGTAARRSTPNRTTPGRTTPTTGHRSSSMGVSRTTKSPRAGTGRATTGRLATTTRSGNTNGTGTVGGVLAHSTTGGSSLRPASPAPRQPRTPTQSRPLGATAGSMAGAGTGASRGPSTLSIHQPPACLGNSLAGLNQQQQRQTDQLREQLQLAQAERQFYYDKLRMIEGLVSTAAGTGRSTVGGASTDVSTMRLARSIRDILYATN